MALQSAGKALPIGRELVATMTSFSDVCIFSTFRVELFYTLFTRTTEMRSRHNEISEKFGKRSIYTIELTIYIATMFRPPSPI